MKKPSENSLGKKFENFEHKPTEGLFDKIREKGLPAPGEFGNSFEGYTHIPGTTVWNAIEATLHPERKRRAIIWWWSAAGVVLILGIGLLWNLNSPGSELISEKTGVNEVKTERAGSSQSKEHEKPKTDEKSSLIDDNSSDFSEKEPILPKNEEKNHDSDQKEHDPNRISPQLANESDTQQGTKPFSETVKMESIALAAITLTRISVDSIPDLLENPPTPPKPSTWSPGLDAVAANVAPSITFGGMAKMDGTEQAFAASSSGSGVTTSGGSFLTNSTEDSRDDVTSIYGGNEEDMMPLSVGGDLRYSLNKKLSITAGLEFTLLRSQTHLFGQTGSILANIKRGYIGVPLGVQFKFREKKDLSMFARWAVIPEMGLYQKVDFSISDNYTGDMPRGEGTQGIFRMQYATALAVGLNYQLSESWNLYGEVASKAYVYQSHYNTYSNQLIWPGIKVGMAFSL